MKNTNLVGLYANISRIYEISKVGNHSVTFAFYSDPEDKERNVNTNDIKIVSEFFGFNPVKDGEIIADFVRAQWSDILSCMTRKYETLKDIEERIKKAKKFERPDFCTNDAGFSLMGTAYERLNFSLHDVEIIKNISCTIAQMAFSENIKIEHIAEAIHYRCIIKDDERVKIY